MKRSIFEDHSVSETGNWNMAAGIAEDLFFKIKNFDEFRTIARNGYLSLAEQLSYMNVPNGMDKIEAVKRMVNILLDLVNDSFALLSKGDKIKIEELKSKINTNKRIIYTTKDNLLFKKTKDQIKNIESLILLPAFEKILEELCELKLQLLVIFYDNDLIFPTTKQFDAKSFKDSIKKRMIEQG